MKCSKCGAELSSDTKFCSYCGTRVKSTMPPPISEDEKENTSDDPHNDPVIEESKKSPEPKSLADRMKEKLSDQWHRLSAYARITTIATVLFALLCLVAVLFGKTAAAIIAIIQIILVVVALLMKKQVIKSPNNWLHIVALILAMVLLLPYVNLFSMDYGDAKKFAWSDILLGDTVPEPNSLFGEIISNREDYLSLYVYKTKLADYNDYVEACKRKTFTLEADQSEKSYYAYNADGYKVSLFYYEDDKKMHIGVDAAEQYGTLEWPDSVIAQMLPVPTSTTGKITQDDEKGFQAYVSNTPIDEYKAYITACSEAGFNVDASEYDKSYSAKNSDGYSLYVSYQGNGVISIAVDEPEYAVSIEVECIGNWFFNKYDVEVYVDDSFEGTVQHGETETFDLALTKGKYVLKFISNEDDSVDGEVEFYIKKDEKLKYKISCSSSGIDVETIIGTSAENVDADRIEKNGFDSTTNDLYTLASYTVEIPEYWKSKSEIDGGFQWYAETSGKVAMLHISAQAETDNSYPVTFDGLMDDNDNMVEMIESTAFREVTDFEVIDTGTIKGVLYKGTIVEEDSGLTGYGEWFAFASEIDRTWCSLIICQTDNTEYSYIDDFAKMIGSIKPVANSSSAITSKDTANAPDDWTNLIEKHYEEVKKQFEDAGFTNIICVAHEVDYNENKVFEGSVVNIAIGENGEICTFNKGQQWEKNVKIRIDYRVKPQKSDTTTIVLPKENSKLGKDFDTKGTSTVYYINVDGTSNKPSLTTWGSATVTDGVAEYLDYLEGLGFTVSITNTTHKEPYSGFHTYDTDFMVSGTGISWTMSLFIQSEKYVEYELDVNLK